MPLKGNHKRTVTKRMLMQLHEPLVSVIILNFNGQDLLHECLQSVFSTNYPNYEVIVVDNASKDNSCEMVEQEFPQVQLIRNQTNCGYSKGNNIGWQASDAKYIWFLNPDMKFLEDSAEKMLNFIKKDESIGALGCQLLYEDRAIQPTVKNSPKLFDQIFTGR